MHPTEAKPKGRLRLRWWMVTLFVAAALPLLLLFLQRNVVNVMHPALDDLSAVSLSERWSHPQMLKIRALGEEAVPSLRRVLREKNNPVIRFLLWVKTKWPSVTKYYSRFPDTQKMTERRWVACQALQTLGPAGKAAMPELIEILKGKDPIDLNAASMAIHAVGIDADVCDRLDAVLEQGAPSFARVQIISALSRIKPPSERTLKALVACLADPASFVQQQAAQALGRFGVSTPEIISALKQLQSTSSNGLVRVSASGALWDLQKDGTLVWPLVIPVLEQELINSTRSPVAGSGGQGVSEGEQIFMAGGDLFQRMHLSDAERATALRLLDAYCRKSGRIFIRMLLLPAMADLGFPPEKCLNVCRDGLGAEEDYYRLQAARLLARLGEKQSLDGIDLQALLRDRDVGVRIYAAKAHWHKNHEAVAVVSVLSESLDSAKYQSYYYAETQPVALAALGEIGPEAKDAVGALEKLLSDPNPAIVGLTSNALMNIRSGARTN